MNGWRRSGVAISLFWFVGVPVYLMVDANITGKAVYESCITSADLAFQAGGFEGDNPGGLRTAQRRCERSFDTMRMPPAKLMRQLVGRDGEDTLSVWAIMLVPIVLLWLVGAASFAAVRRIRRRSAHSGKA